MSDHQSHKSFRFCCFRNPTHAFAVEVENASTQVGLELKTLLLLIAALAPVVVTAR